VWVKRRRHDTVLGRLLYRKSTVYELTKRANIDRQGLTSLVASTSEHLEKLARDGVLVDTVKGESLPGGGGVDKAGCLSVFIDGS
jgi:hypothetical protein